MIGTIAVSIIMLFVAYMLFWKLYFLRDPERFAPEGNYVVAPADGKVIEIRRIDTKTLKVKKGALGRIYTLASDTVKEGYLISIFMSPFNVHVNRAPIAGTIRQTKHVKGMFCNAKLFEKSLLNEKNEIIIKGKITVKVIQVAGFLARRIECFVRKGQKVKIGERIGLINLGSQVTIIVPDIEIIAKVGDRTRAGETVLAKY